MKSQNIVIDRFKEAIDRSLMSREKIGKILGCSASSVTKKYNGDRKILVEDIINLSKYLDISPMFLLGFTKERSNDGFVQEICSYTGLTSENVLSLKLGNEFSDYSKRGITFLNLALDSIVFDVGKSILDIDKIISNKTEYLASNIKLLKTIYADMHCSIPSDEDEAMKIINRNYNEASKIIKQIDNYDNELSICENKIIEQFMNLLSYMYSDVEGDDIGYMSLDNTYKALIRDIRKEKINLMMKARLNNDE